MTRARDEKYQWDDPPSAANLPADVIVSPDSRKENRLPPAKPARENGPYWMPLERRPLTWMRGVWM